MICRSWIFLARFLHTDQYRARNLHNRRDNIGGDKESQDDLRAQERVAAAQSWNECGENRIDARREKYRSRHDEEVIQNEIDEIVGVLLGRKRSGDVSDNFEDQPDGKCHPPPAASRDVLRRMDDEMKEKPRGGENSDCDGWRIAVDNYAGVIFPMGNWKIRVNVAE